MRLNVSFVLFALVTALLIPISASAQTDVSCTAVHDSNGTRIGRWQFGSVHFEHQGRVVQVLVSKSGFFDQGVDVNFTGPNCTGDAYMGESSGIKIIARPNIIANDVWHIDTRDVLVQVVVVSRLESNGDCLSPGTLTKGAPAYHFPLPAVTPPFHLEPEPCFTPEDPDPEQIINGCVKNKNGALRIVGDPADCTSRETPISWLGE